MFSLKPRYQPAQTVKFLTDRQAKTAEQNCLAGWFFGRPLRALVLIGLLHATAAAQWRDDFEAGPLRWRLWRDDAGTRIVQHQRIATVPHSGVASEMIEVSVGLQGSYVHLFYPLDEPLSVIDELTASFWVRAASSGMKPALRVVFPRTAHPATSEPLTTLLFGQPSIASGQWTRLEISRATGLLDEQRRVLKAQFGPAVDLREAYVDGVVLDVFNGAGNTKVQIDDLAIDGMVPAAADRALNPELAEDRSQPMDSPDVIAARSRDLRASVPRWLQYRGESLDWLASIGINGIVIDQPPTTALLAEANRLQIAVIAPPPPTLPDEAEWRQWEAVQGWALGWALDGTHLESSRDMTVRLNRLPISLQRPTLAEAMEAYGPFARLVDLLAVPIPLPTTLKDHDEAGRILHTSLQPMRGRTLPLASIMLEPIAEWRQQRDLIADALGVRVDAIDSYDLEQARLAWIRSIGHGVRGWYVRTLTPLDSGLAVDGVRAESLRGLTTELGLIMPWIQSGEQATSLPMDRQSGYVAHRIEMPRSQLILLTLRGEHDSVVIPSNNLPSLPMTLPRHQQTTQVYRISRGQLESLPARPSSEGWKIDIPNPGMAEMLVVTEDPRAIGYLQSQLQSIAPTIAESRISAAEQSLRVLEMSLAGEQIPFKDKAWKEVALAKSNLRAAEEYLARGDLLRCSSYADAATAQADHLLRQSWQRALIRFPSANSSPLVSSRLSLPLHWELNRVLVDRSWQPHTIPSGDFDDLSRLLADGWGIDRRLEDRVAAEIQCLDQAGPDGSPALLVSAQPNGSTPISGGYAGASMRIESPPLSVLENSLVHIEGRVRVLSCSDEPQCGLLVYDSMGGPALGQLINLQSGDANTWQRIDLYRMSQPQTPFRIQLEARGGVKVLIDQLRLESLMPSPTPR